MSLIDTLIKKVEELTKAVNSIRSSSKKIHELPDLSGEDVYVAASNGNETGKVLLQTQNLIPPPTISNSWKDIELLPSSNLIFNRDNTSINLITNRNSWGVTIPNIKGFGRSEPTDGLNGFLRNGSSELIVIKHNLLSIPGITIPFFLSSGSDYSIKPNEILSFKYSSLRNRCEISVYDFSAITPLTPKSEVFRISQEHLDSENVVFELESTPSENEFLFVFCNGQLLNNAGISVVENILIIDKKTIEYEFRVGMKITVNYKH
ncbi:hypothetical protein EG240_05875 [Paenimyroides tangerinum]|uniref:Uncharacterized protein n=1 Tax=Paenimyroides tangerinum TaxID=2488728 RepID=A0A3P3WG72_9FLAO|nr:hypothetical protein [Paenimyroides tangerinum]RRJ91533.1 hypothetical protein EG240_05875 [Paenimyroides tangerinum]